MKKKLSKEQQEMIQQFDKAFHMVKRIAVISSFVILFVVAFESSFSTNTSYALIQNETLPETFSLKNTGTTLKQIGDIDVNIYAGKYRQCSDPLFCRQRLLFYNERTYGAGSGIY